MTSAKNVLCGILAMALILGSVPASLEADCYGDSEETCKRFRRCRNNAWSEWRWSAAVGCLAAGTATVAACISAVVAPTTATITACFAAAGATYASCAETAVTLYVGITGNCCDEYNYCDCDDSIYFCWIWHNYCPDPPRPIYVIPTSWPYAYP